MSLALIIPDRKLDDLQQRLQAALPNTKIEIWPDLTSVQDVSFAVVWKQPQGSLASLPNLKAIQCFGAGVDAILSDPTLPDLPIARIVDSHLTQSMLQYLDGIVSYYLLRFDLFSYQQRQQIWKPKSPRRIENITVLGLGELGRAAAQYFAQKDYHVSGWARTSKQLPDVSCFYGDAGLQEATANADIIICLLPLTSATENMLNSAFFSQLKAGAILINAARGAIVDDTALLNALTNGQLEAACLDVFRQEPLPKEHPFWTQPKVLITPHISAVTNVGTAVAQIVENYQRCQRGDTLLNLVDVVRGY